MDVYGSSPDRYDGARKRGNTDISELDGVVDSDSDSSYGDEDDAPENNQYIKGVLSEVLNRTWLVDDGFRYPVYVTDSKHLGGKMLTEEQVTMEELVEWVGGQRQVEVQQVREKRNPERHAACGMRQVAGTRTPDGGDRGQALMAKDK